MSRRQRLTLYSLFIVLGLAIIAYRLYTGPWRYRRVLSTDPDQTYYLYVPKRDSPETPLPLFVFVHGTGSSGLPFVETWKKHADAEGFVLLCPTFKRTSYMHLLDGEDTALLDIIAEVAQEYPLRDRFFLAGLSGGAQFAHRFAFRHPERLCGAATHSAGSYDLPAPAANGVPFVVTVGERDTQRLDLARWFADALAQQGYAVTFTVIPNVGHRLSPQAVEETLHLFREACSAR